MNEFLTSVSSLLAANGFGTIGSSLWKASLPSTPYVATAVYLNGGPSGPDQPVRIRAVQIIHRNTNVQSGSSLVNSLFALFDDKWMQLPDFPGRFTCDNEPGLFGYDGNNLPVFALDLTFTSIK